MTKYIYRSIYSIFHRQQDLLHKSNSDIIFNLLKVVIIWYNLKYSKYDFKIVLFPIAEV